MLNTGVIWTPIFCKKGQQLERVELHTQKVLRCFCDLHLRVHQYTVVVLIHNNKYCSMLSHHIGDSSNGFDCGVFLCQVNTGSLYKHICTHTLPPYRFTTVCITPRKERNNEVSYTAVLKMHVLYMCMLAHVPSCLYTVQCLFTLVYL